MPQLTVVPTALLISMLGIVTCSLWGCLHEWKWHFTKRSRGVFPVSLFNVLCQHELLELRVVEMVHKSHLLYEHLLYFLCVKVLQRITISRICITWSMRLKKAPRPVEEPFGLDLIPWCFLSLAGEAMPRWRRCRYAACGGVLALKQPCTPSQHAQEPSRGDLP